jgi:hypothetical protein
MRQYPNIQYYGKIYRDEYLGIVFMQITKGTIKQSNALKYARYVVEQNEIEKKNIHAALPLRNIRGKRILTSKNN